MNLDDYRAESLASWNRLAAGWSRQHDFIWSLSAPVSAHLIERLEPQPGQTVLELAAGMGDTGFLAARRLGAGGKLISTDFAPAMVEEARRRSAALGLHNIEHRVLDAERMDLDDDSVDGVLCRWGYMLMADPRAALAETRRVLRDGGRLCFSVWAAPDRNPAISIPGMEMIARGHLPRPVPGAPGIFSMADPARIEALVKGGGFANLDIEQITSTARYDDADHHWRVTMEISGPIAEAIGRLPDDERDSVRRAVREKIEPLIAAGPVPGVCHNVTAW